jgi:hypothetical protein
MSHSTPYQRPEGPVSLIERQSICQAVVGAVDWSAEGAWGYCACPGADLHQGKSAKRDCRVFAEETHRGGSTNPPGVYCLHRSCAGLIEEAAHKIRSAIGKAKYEAGRLLSRTPPPRAPSVGQKGVREVRTVRTCNFGVPEEKEGKPAAAEAEFRTPRTGQTHLLTRFAHVRTHAHSFKEGAFQASEASGPEKAVAQPLPAPKPQPGPQPRQDTAVPLAEPPGIITLCMKGEPARRGHWVGSEFVTEFIFNEGKLIR